MPRNRMVHEMSNGNRYALDFDRRLERVPHVVARATIAGGFINETVYECTEPTMDRVGVRLICKYSHNLY